MNPQTFLIIGAFTVSALSMPFCIWLARRLGIVDRPAHRKIHASATPYLGGLGLVTGVVAALLAGFFIFPQFSDSKHLSRALLLLGPCIAAAVLGLADDEFQVRARVKLLSQIVIALLFSYFCIHISLVYVPGWGHEEMNDLGIPLTVAWILGVVNGVNLIDGIDGLAGSVTAVIYAAIAFIAGTIKDQAGLPNPDWAVMYIALAGCGATLGFLIFNWSPAKIYLGDCGSLASGFLIASLLLAMGGQFRVSKDEAALNALSVEPFPYQFAIITLIVFYPLVEITLTIIRRLLAGKPIGSADKGHIHHRLLKWGWSAPQICGAAAFMSLLTFGITATVRVHYHGVTVWLLITLAVSFVLLLHFSGFLEMLHPGAIKGNRPHFLIANHFTSMQLIKLDLAQSVGEVAELAAQTSIEFGVERYRLTSPARDGVGEFVHDWIKPASAHGSYLRVPHADTSDVVAGTTSRAPQIFSDKVEFKNGASASWIFEPYVSEDEIDVEYKVLVNDFMRKALRRVEAIQSIKNGQAEHLRTGEIAPGVSSSMLRRRGSQRVGHPPTAPIPSIPEKKAGD